jgi:hypothetical protein
MKTATRPDARARLVRLIHVAKRELNMDDDSYRAMLTGCVKKDSASAMTRFSVTLKGDAIAKLEAMQRRLSKPVPLMAGVAAELLSVTEDAFVRERVVGGDKRRSGIPARHWTVEDATSLDGEQKAGNSKTDRCLLSLVS